MPIAFTPFPKHLEPADAASLTTEAVDWALMHGLVMRFETEEAQPDMPPLATHAPVNLLPSPFSRDAFAQAKRIQVLFNLLVHRISLHETFLDEVCQSVADVDTFTKALYEIYCKARTPIQPIQLGIHRSDYMLHEPEGAGPLILQQVELNTISASFSSLSYLTGQLHRHLLRHWHPELVADLPENASGTSFADGIAEAWQLYGNHKAVVVMIVQPGEKNVFDQRWIEYQLLTKHGITLLRRSLTQMAESATVTAGACELFVNGLEVAVVYYRAGYTPVDYPSDKEWDVRLRIELSKAIKCPSIAYHLAGLKKVQQVVADSKQLQRFMTANEASELSKCFTGLFSLADDQDGQAAANLAISKPHAYVLKPQREGGGNNFYDEEAKEMLLKLTPKERSAYILMERISAPSNAGHTLRKGVLTECDTLSELGVYGIFIGKNEDVLVNREGGHILRTKDVGVNEGGVAAGFAHIDSPLLYD